MSKEHKDLAPNFGDAMHRQVRWAQAADPGASANNGDLWFDTDDNRLYLRVSGAWQIVRDAVPFLYALSLTTVSWVNLPAAVTESGATPTQRFKKDLSGASQVRCFGYCATAGSTGSVARVQYSTDNVVFSEIGASNPDVAISAVGWAESPWVNLVAGAKADVWIRLVAAGGDGVADPAVARFFVEFR